MVIYLTYNDAPSGIYSSQVIDVVNFGRKSINERVRLVAFISIRNFSINKRLIKSQLSDAIVLPMIPRIKNWILNSILLFVVCLFLKPEKIIGRSVLATKLALIMRKIHLCKKVVYDGRGAISAEWKEYKVVEDKILLDKIESYEREVVLDSDYRIAVSKALSNYWRDHFNYLGNDFVNIPCTINVAFENIILSNNGIINKRSLLNYKDDDVIFMYSGSLAGWQSFKLVNTFLTKILITNSKYKVLFLSREDKYILDLKQHFPNQVQCIHLSPEQVPDVLQIGDYGILIREHSITNLVASPVKFAEYLACGLKVLISEELGDYSKFTLDSDCGYLFKNIEFFKSIPIDEKLRLQKIAQNNFFKDCFSESYLKLFS